MSEENVEILRRAFEAFNRRDADGFATLCTQDVEIVPIRAAVEDTIYRGPDAVNRFFTESDQVWDHLRVEVDEIHDLGDRVLVLGLFCARGRASGAEVEIKAGWVAELEGGLIAAARTYASGEDALEAAGLSE
ncbi:MAG: nuclear transport factor 2 family protein [Solirubrobacterales bacterium]